MGLSDELLAKRGRLAAVRSELRELVAEVGASAGFLVDEEGSPFATVGHVEFTYPHPLAGLMEEGSGDALLKALVGEAEVEESSSYLVKRVGSRALLVVVLEPGLSRAERRTVSDRLEPFVTRLTALF